MEKETKIGIFGLGYAGLPVACLFAQKYEVRGYDMSEQRIQELREGNDRGRDFSAEELLSLQRHKLHLTTNMEELRDCNFYVVIVPTPVDNNNQPELSCLESASEQVGSLVGKGDVVVYESTVYPGVTEDFCVPIIEKVSGLRFNEDFFVGFSPERINPGDKFHTIHNTVKITSGSTPATADYVDEVYSSVLEAGTHKASSVKVAETAKVLENVQRDVNIALMNELAKIMAAMDVDTNEVIDAAATKWNFLPFRPGLVGGHCIGVDPFYLIKCAEQKGINPQLIRSARNVNDSMGMFVAEQVLELLQQKGLHAASANVLLLGFTFKENCPDIRNTKVFDIYNGLLPHVGSITIADPCAYASQVKQEYGLDLTDVHTLEKDSFDAVILCVSHKAFRSLDIRSLLKKVSVVYDVKAFLKTAQVDKRL